MMEDNTLPLIATVGAATAVAGVAAAYYLNQTPEPNFKPTVDLSNQSYLLPDGSRCSKMVPEGELLTTLEEGIETLYDVFQKGLSKSENEPCLGQRSGPNLEYEWITYRQVHDKALAFGSWLLDHGFESGRQKIIGIYSANRPEWVITEQACSAFNIVNTSLYDTLGPDSIQYVINLTNMRLIVCDKADKVNQLLAIKDKLKSIEIIVVMNGLEGVNIPDATKHGVKVVSFQDALIEGEANLKKAVPLKTEDVAFICFTSGTTGNPKGVMMTHANIISCCAAVDMTLQSCRKYKKDDVYISYLPLPHMYERMAQQLIFYAGTRIGFSRGDVKLLLDDIQTLKPTFFASVPRLLNRIYDKIMIGVEKSTLKKTLMTWGIAAKKREVERFVIRKDGFWDKLMFNKIQAVLGGRVEMIITASAPLEAKVLDFLRCALGCVIVEGYGQSECCTAGTLTVRGTFTAGHVGPPAPCNYIKLVDCVDEGYLAENGEGEVCIKGPNVLTGYFRDPQKTAETIDKDGWLHTGDVGRWLPEGTLKIIDRKKHLFKLSQGEYVAPEKIEIVYVRSLFVAQVFVDGDSLQSFVVAIVVPEEEMLLAWAKQQNQEGTFKEFCENENIRKIILEDLTKLGKEAGLHGFEMVKDIALHSELFSVDNGLLTPTFKNKRPFLRKYFKEQISALYKKHSS